MQVRAVSEVVHFRSLQSSDETTRPGGFTPSGTGFVKHGGEYTRQWEIKSPEPGQQYFSSIRISRHQRLQIGLGQAVQTSDAGNAFSPLTDGTGALLILHHDLLSLTGRGKSIRSSFLNPDGTGYEWAKTEWHQGDHKGVEFDWPAPPCTSFWDLEYFVSMWNHALRNLGPSPTPGNLSFIWLSAGTAVCDGRPPEPLTSMNGTANWEALRQRLIKLTEMDQLNPRFPLAQEWLIRVAVLQMPEMRAPGLDYNTLTDSSTDSSPLVDHWNAQANLIVSRRARLLADLIIGDMALLAESLRATPLALTLNDELIPNPKRVEELAGVEVDLQRQQIQLMEQLSRQSSDTQQQISAIQQQLGRSDDTQSVTQQQISSMQEHLSDLRQQSHATQQDISRLNERTDTNIATLKILNDDIKSMSIHDPQPKQTSSKSSPPKVFISYIHDSPRQNNHVPELAARLRGNGIDCQIDLDEQFLSKQQMANLLMEFDIVLVVWTGEYRRMFDEESKLEKPQGVVVTEDMHYFLRDRVKFMSIVFSKSSSRHIPPAFRNEQVYHLDNEEVYQSLINEILRP